MSLTGTSLNAVTTAGVGSVISFDRPRSPVSMQIHVTGAPSGTAALEVSIDGVNFVQLSPIGIGGDSISTSQDAVVAARANLISISGGTSPTVTAIIGAV